MYTVDRTATSGASVDKFKGIQISFVTCTFDLVSQGRLTTIRTNKVNGARDKANFDLIELVHPKKVRKKSYF